VHISFQGSAQSKIPFSGGDGETVEMESQSSPAVFTPVTQLHLFLLAEHSWPGMSVTFPGRSQDFSPSAADLDPVTEFGETASEMNLCSVRIYGCSRQFP
jgi:hypothetical protein